MKTKLFLVFIFSLATVFGLNGCLSSGDATTKQSTQTKNPPTQKQQEQAVEDYKKAMEIKEKAQKFTPEAVKLIQKSCDVGFVIACLDLGLLYFKGEGIPKDLDKAATMVEKFCPIDGQSGTSPEMAYACGLLSGIYYEKKDANKFLDYTFTACEKLNVVACGDYKRFMQYHCQVNGKEACADLQKFNGELKRLISGVQQLCNTTSNPVEKRFSCDFVQDSKKLGL